MEDYRLIAIGVNCQMHVVIVVNYNPIITDGLIQIDKDNN